MHRIELEHLEQHLEHFLSSSPSVDQCTTLKTSTTLHKCTKVVGRCNTFLHFFFFDRQLRYVGQSETDKSRSTLLRSCVEVSTSDNLTTFLKELGFRSFFLFIILFDCLSRIPLTNFQTCCMKNGIYRWLVFHYLPWMFISVPYSHRHESEFVLKGYYFVKGHMRITVSQVCRVRSHLCTKWINTAGPSCSKLG